MLEPTYDVNGGKTAGTLSWLDIVLNLVSTPKLTYSDRLSQLIQSETPATEWFHKELAAWVVDISKWNGQIYWPTLWAEADGAVLRCGYGAITDERYSLNIAGFSMPSSQGKYKALYHYMYDWVPVISQIDQVLFSIDKVGPDKIQAFWSDIEGHGNTPTSASFKDNPLKIMEAVKGEFPHLNVGFYTNGEIWKTLGKPVEWLDKYLLWLAWYPYNPDTTRFPKVPEGLSTEDIYKWQISGTGNGLGSLFGSESPDLDFNLTRDRWQEVLKEMNTGYKVPAGAGEEEYMLEAIMRIKTRLLSLRDAKSVHGEAISQALNDLSEVMDDIMVSETIFKASFDEEIQMIEQELAAVEEVLNPPDPEPTEPEFIYEAKVIAGAGLNVRAGAGTNFSVLGKLPAGTVVRVYDEVQKTDYLWARISSTTSEWVAAKYLEKI